jgi:hypothetical protein
MHPELDTAGEGQEQDILSGLSSEEKVVFLVLARYPSFSFTCRRITSILAREGYLDSVNRSDTYHVRNILVSLSRKGWVDIRSLSSPQRGNRYKMSVLFKQPGSKGN